MAERNKKGGASPTAGGIAKKPLLVLSGQYQNGKSTFLNCLLGGSYAVEGSGLTTTRYNAKYVFGDFREGKVIAENGGVRNLPAGKGFFSAADTIRDMKKSDLLQISAYSPILMGMDILDSPGCGADSQDNAVAEKAISLADFVIYILQKTLDNEEDISFLKNLTEQGKHFTVILNCRNEADPNSEQASAMCREIMARIKNEKLESNYVALQKDKPVYPVNLLWAQCGLGYPEEAEFRKKWNKLKIYLEDESITPLALLARSNFLPIRTLLSSFVSAFFSYAPTSRLSLMSAIAENWTSELVSIFEKE